MCELEPYCEICFSAVHYSSDPIGSEPADHGRPLDPHLRLLVHFSAFVSGACTNMFITCAAVVVIVCGARELRTLRHLPSEGWDFQRTRIDSAHLRKAASARINRSRGSKCVWDYSSEPEASINRYRLLLVTDQLLMTAPTPVAS